MSDVLSQSEIDALLNSMLSGGGDAPKEETEPDKKYRKYDFKSPKKFTKDRIKMLNSIYENYVRIINSRLNALLRANCEITVESIEEQRYYEFSNALSEGDVLTLAEVKVKDKVEETPLIFFLSMTTALNIMDHLMGGEGTPDKQIPSDYTYTDLELRLYEDTVKDLLSVMGSSWENYIPVEINYNKTEINPTLSQVIGLDEVVVIVDAKVAFPKASGRLSVCLPGEMLTNIFAEISRENPIRRVTAEDKSQEIFDSLRDSELEIVAELGNTQLLLEDVFHLSVGDVIDLGHPQNQPIYLGIGGYHWFTGRIGTYKKNMAIKIDEVCYQAEQGAGKENAESYI